MGIPSYFSFIVKNHSKIIRKIVSLNKRVDNFYLDSNSIIYDCLRSLEKTSAYKSRGNKFETELIINVCKKIDEYVLNIKPTNVVYIAFDGVAPVAKLEQQRNRRYKSYLLECLKNKYETRQGVQNIAQHKIWDKTAITPGTNFMNNLNKYVTEYYKGKEDEYNIASFIVSPSCIPGEGEHKIFEYIRNNCATTKNEVNMVYGLDADLIMLALNHLHVSKHLYLYRETPEFIKSINIDLEPNSLYFLDIPNLAKTIIKEMNGSSNVNKTCESSRLHDYILLCFFLGNDFMPHFPSVNIRSGGIYIMLAAYQNLFGNTNKILTNGKKIYWHNVKLLIEYLAETEYTNLMDEYNKRARREKRNYSCRNIEEMMTKLDNIPTKERDVEKFIDPENSGWQIRYYKTLFGIDINRHWKKKICINYLEGLEWTMKYYTSGCVDWRWSYKYNYPPLWADLAKYVPSWDTTMIEMNEHVAVKPEIQLAYVLPRPSLKLLPAKFHKQLVEKMIGCYPLDCKIYWAFCTYFWEGHADLPFIDINDLEKIYTF